MTATGRAAVRVTVAMLLVGAAFGGAWLWLHLPRRITVSAGAFPEQLVYARASDDVINAGALFSAQNGASDAAAVIWVHGWGANFHYPTYTSIGRRLAARGTTTISVNTRMHDLGTSATYRQGRRVRGGGYWGVPSEQDLDIAAWVDFAEQLGYPRVVLAGHSAGWAAVAAYRVRSQDPRVVGVVLASGAVRRLQPPDDEDQLDKARRLVEAGRGDELMPLPNRSFPSYISAATMLDQAQTPVELLDFFGEGGGTAGIARLGCPVLAFFGTRGDVGGPPELELVRSASGRLSLGPLRIDTSMIEGADHMYTGEEDQVARTIADWIARAVPPAH